MTNPKARKREDCFPPNLEAGYQIRPFVFPRDSYLSSFTGDISCDMYAVRRGSSIYHLMQRKGGDVTVCGLKVRMSRVKLTTGLTNTPTEIECSSQLLDLRKLISPV